MADQWRDILLNSIVLRTIPVNPETAEIAAQVRAEYGTRTPDAIQLATALREGATHFLTNDARLSAVSELDVLVLDQLI